MAVTGMGSVHLLQVPSFLKAKTPALLHKAMLENNLRLKSFVTYFDLQFANGYWYAWYQMDLSKTLKGK